jgi:hypothetical protein
LAKLNESKIKYSVFFPCFGQLIQYITLKKQTHKLKITNILIYQQKPTTSFSHRFAEKQTEPNKHNVYKQSDLLEQCQN